MLYGEYEFHCIFDNDAVLPAYKGSTFRGVFGHALKKVVCALKRQDCGDCLLREKCLYPFVFEIAPERTTSSPQVKSLAPVLENHQQYNEMGKKRIVAPPHPYVIEPDLNRQTRYQAGEHFDFKLILFGRANDYLPYFIYAFHEMGKQGVGKGREEGKGTFRLADVTANGCQVYNAGDGRVQTGVFASALTLSAVSGTVVTSATHEPNPSVLTGGLSGAAPAPASATAGTPHTPATAFPCTFSEGAASAVQRIDLTLVTPLRLKFDNHLEVDLPFHVLVRAMLRRASSLLQYHGAGEPVIDYRGLVERAQDATITAADLRWFDWRRYSNRQDQAMLMGGIIGSVTYAGALDEFIPLIRFCEKTHLGKQTTFGLGKIAVTIRY